MGFWSSRSIRCWHRSSFRFADSAAKVLGAKVDALKAEIIADTKTQVGDVEKKILFNQDGHGEIGFSKTLGGSVVDFSSMKALAGMPLTFGPDEAKNGAAMGAAFAGIGSPWKRLSPTMEKFAKLLATGFKNAENSLPSSAEKQSL